MEHPKCASLRWALALPANIILGWKGLPESNTLAYYENPKIKAIKSFILQAPGGKLRLENDKPLLKEVLKV